MDYFIIILIIVALLSILYVWYISKSINNYPDDKILDLSTDEDKILSNWYSDNLKIIYEYGINEEDIAVEYLHNVYNLEVDPKSIVIGNNIYSQYMKITGKELPKDSIFDLRSSLGIPGEIAIITNNKIRNKLIRTNNYDIKMLYEIVKSGVDKNAHLVLQEILKYRWTKIKETLNLEGSGSYLYLQSENIPDTSTFEVFPGVVSSVTDNSFRINLLCTDLEFNTFLKRATNKLVTTN